MISIHYMLHNINILWEYLKLQFPMSGETMELEVQFTILFCHLIPSWTTRKITNSLVVVHFFEMMDVAESLFEGFEDELSKELAGVLYLSLWQCATMLGGDEDVRST